jgi:hypothetical protein
MLLRNLMLVGMFCFTAGCSNQPWVEPNPATTQQKLSAAQQWGLIADDVTEQTRLALLKADYLDTATPVYVSESTNAHFDRGFRNYMITSLVNAGFNVVTQKEGAVEIQYESQVIRHGSSFDPRARGYKPGAMTAGVASFWVLREAGAAGLAVGTIAAAAGLDFYNARKPTNVELLLTTSIVQGNRYLMRNTNAYYIEKADAYLFEPCRSKSLLGCRPKQF